MKRKMTYSKQDVMLQAYLRLKYALLARLLLTFRNSRFTHVETRIRPLRYMLLEHSNQPHYI